MGTSPTLHPSARARTIISIWNTYPRDTVAPTISRSTSVRYSLPTPFQSPPNRHLGTHLKLPVTSLTPGASTVAARKFAARETSLRPRPQPCTPPACAPASAGLPPALYRVPATMSRLCACCCRINCGINLGCALQRRSQRPSDTHMVRKVRVHDHHKVSTHILQSMHVRRPQAQFACTGFQDLSRISISTPAASTITHNFLLPVHPRELSRNLLCPVRARIIHHNDFPS